VIPTLLSEINSFVLKPENTAAKKDYPEADRFEKPNNAQEPPPKREDAQTYVVRSPYFSSGNDPQGYSGYYFGRRHPHA